MTKDTKPSSNETPTFEKLLVRWNGGIRRGAQTRFAKAVSLAQPTVARWVSGEILPGEDIRPKVAKLLGVTVEGLMNAITQTIDIARSRYGVPPGKIPASLRETVGSYGRASALVPVVARVTEKSFRFSFDEIPQEYLPITLLNATGKKFASLLLESDAFSDLGQEGEYVLLAESETPEEGRWVVLSKEGEQSFARFSAKEHSISGEKSSRTKTGGEVVAAVLGIFRRP